MVIKMRKQLLLGKGIDEKRLKGTFWSHRTTLYLALLGVKQAYTIVKTHQTEQGISIHCTPHKLHFN